MEEKSSGAVVFRRSGNDTLFLLLHYPSGHWDFVKGKMEKDESPHQTAIREAKEETGLQDLEFVDGFEENIKYDFQWEGELINKQVVFFLAESHTEKITISHEHVDFVWLNFEEALQKITYENAKKVLNKANDLISKTL